MSFTHNIRSRGSGAGIVTDTEKVITFVVPEILTMGVQQPHIIFPFEGELEFANAFVNATGMNETIIDVEKSSDYEEWESIFDKKLVFNALENFDNGEYEFKDIEVNKNEVFRIKVNQTPGNVANLTLNIGIKIKQ